MTEVSVNGSREEFLELQEKALCVLRERGQQGSSHTRALRNAHAITISREGKRFTLSWFNGADLDTSRSYLNFRWNDRLSKWIRDNILFPGRLEKRTRFANRRKARAEKHARQKKASAVGIEELRKKFCPEDTQDNAA